MLPASTVSLMDDTQVTGQLQAWQEGQVQLQHPAGGLIRIAEKQLNQPNTPVKDAKKKEPGDTECLIIYENINNPTTSSIENFYLDNLYFHN